MKYIIQRFGRIFFESNSMMELKDSFERLIGTLTIQYMNEERCLDGKEYDVFQCAEGYSLLIRK